jgi:hypothetical protein
MEPRRAWRRPSPLGDEVRLSRFGRVGCTNSFARRDPMPEVVRTKRPVASRSRPYDVASSETEPDELIKVPLD